MIEERRGESEEREPGGLPSLTSCPAPPSLVLPHVPGHPPCASGKFCPVGSTSEVACMMSHYCVGPSEAVDKSGWGRGKD